MLYDIFIIIYFAGSLAGLSLLFRKVGLAWWKALVPIWNIVLWARLCNKKSFFYVGLFVPAINIFFILLLVVESARCCRRYNFFEQAAGILFPWIYIPLLGAHPGIVWHDPKTDPPKKVSEARDWADSLVFAVIAACIIRGFLIELYNIPSSSMEKSLLVGDHLVVSKIAYGPRATMTPLAVPLVHNTLPGTKGKVESFSRLLELPYHRYPGLGHVKRYDAVVFNYPDGDTMCSAQFSNRSYHDLVRRFGKEAVHQDQVWDEYGERIEIGKIRVRPVDKRENFIKRCIGLPGEDLQIVNQEVFIDGSAIKTPFEAQFTYAVRFNDIASPRRVMEQLGVSQDDLQYAEQRIQYSGVPYYILPLTPANAAKLSNKYEVLDVQPLIHLQDSSFSDESLFPHVASLHWTIDNYGPVHIPAAGEVIALNDSTLPYYRRIIEVYEGNSLEVREGQILINGQPTTHYTVKQNYYWMMGDNRHNSVDSRYWGFVPEDHIVGKAWSIYFSWDKDHHKIRWNRFLRHANKY